MVAYKMETGGEPGRINVSEDTKLLLESNPGGNECLYRFIPNKMIRSIESNKEFNSYFIENDCLQNDSNSE
jgi:hypothetical protein